MKARARLAVAASLLLAAARAPAQGVPVEFEAGFDTVPARAACNLDVPFGEGERIMVDLAFRNRPGRLAVTAGILGRTSAGLAMGQEEWDTTFAPTSVCPAGGQHLAFFVVDWDSAERRVVVEEWTVGGFTVKPGAVPGEFELELPPPRRRPLLDTRDLPIVRCAAFHPQAGLLFLLCDGEPVTIRALDVSTGRIEEQPVATSATHPLLREQRSLVAGRDRDSGFLLYTERRPRWGDPILCPPPCRVLELRDADLDGRFDAAAELDWDAFVESHAGRWVPVEDAAPEPAAPQPAAPEEPR